MAAALTVPPSQLTVSEGSMRSHEEVVVTRRSSDTMALASDPPWVQRHKPRPWPDTGSHAAYSVEPLARTPHQPQLKTFNFAVHADVGAMMQCGLHQFLYVHGDAPTMLQWGDNFEHEKLLAPGDSAYIAPMVSHRFNAFGGKEAQVYNVRIPGQLTDETWREFASFEPHGRHRVGNESMRWY
eukprot:SAG11_NODE_1364_length_5109_cov_2.966866_10_plen_183_part_00